MTSSLLATVLALSLPELRWDERIAAAVLALALAGVTWAFAYTTAEGALRTQRLVLQRCADAVVLVALYAAARILLA
jgi:hypothetical protein